MLAWAAIELTRGLRRESRPRWHLAGSTAHSRLPDIDRPSACWRTFALRRRSPAFPPSAAGPGLGVPKVVVAGTALHLALAGAGLGLMALGASDLWLIGCGFLVVLGTYAFDRRRHAGPAVRRSKRILNWSNRPASWMLRKPPPRGFCVSGASALPGQKRPRGAVFLGADSVRDRGVGSVATQGRSFGSSKAMLRTRCRSAYFPTT